jgi:bacterioferritin-associated ferredoxin
MYVCVCHAVTDGQIREAVCEGIGTLRELRAALGVASRCGRCAECARDILSEALKQASGQAEQAA